MSAPDDLWLHARGLHSAHVVIRTNGKQPPESVVAFAAAVCAKYSAGKGEKIPVDVCEIKYVRRIKGAKAGLVTYTDFSESFLGGAHGISSMSGVTFRKSDGRRFGQEMLRNTDTEAFRKLLKDGLKQYFSSASQDSIDDGQLAQLLLTDSSVDYLPLPQATPYLTKDGVAFVYQPYEIAPYAAGRPSFTVPYEKIKPFLIETILKLI